MTATPDAASGTEGSTGPVAALALGYMALWPAGAALAALARPDLSGALIYPLAAIGGALFAVAGLLRGEGGPVALFRPWQRLCLGIVLAVFAYGLAFPSHDRMAALVLCSLHVFLIAGAFGAASLLRAGGARMVRAFLLCIIASVTFYALVWLAFQDAFLLAAKGEWPYAFPPFVNVRKYTSLLAVAALLSLALWSLREWPASGAGRILRNLPLVLWLLLLSLLFWTGGRAPAAALTVALFTALVFWPDGATRRRMCVAAVAGLVVAATLSALLPRASTASGLVQRLAETSTAPSVELATTHRAGIWVETLHLIAERPLLGHGYNQWTLQRPEFVLHGSTHNLPLQVVHDFGLIGGMALLALVFGTWAGHLRHLRKAHPLHLAAMIMLTSLLAQSFVDAIFVTTASLQLALYAFAVAHATARLSRPDATMPLLQFNISPDRLS